MAFAEGFKYLKFSPAEAAGGVNKIKAIQSAFKEVSFCPTGGVSLKNYKDYLALDSVFAVGGSFLAPRKLIDEAKFELIEPICGVS